MVVRTTDTENHILIYQSYHNLTNMEKLAASINA